MPPSQLARGPSPTPPRGGVLNPPGLSLWLVQSDPRTRTASPWPGLPWPSQATPNPPGFERIKRTDPKKYYYLWVNYASDYVYQ